MGMAEITPVELAGPIGDRHVEKAMRSLGWTQGTKPPSYAAIRTKLTELFERQGNGSSTGDLRDAVVARYAVSEQPLAASMAVKSGVALPSELGELFTQAAGNLSAIIEMLDGGVADYLVRERDHLKNELSEQLDAVHVSAEERVAAISEELAAALSGMDDRDMKLSRAAEELLQARKDAAEAAGRAEQLANELVDAKSIAEKERDASATAKGRIERLEGTNKVLEEGRGELIERNSQINSKLEELTKKLYTLEAITAELTTIKSELNETKAALAKCDGKLEATTSELATRSNTVKELDETKTLMSKRVGELETMLEAAKKGYIVREQLPLDGLGEKPYPVPVAKKGHNGKK